MANIPQKSKDPTEDALHAIQEALSAGQPDRSAVPPVTANADIAQDEPTSADLFNEPRTGDWDSGQTPRRRRQ